MYFGTMNPEDPLSSPASSSSHASGGAVPPPSAPTVSLVIPLLNESESLPELARQILQAFREGLPEDTAEVIFVDDGSSDGSWQVIRELTGRSHAEERVRFHGIRFQRNYGKSAALQAGFERAGGAVVVTLDADLQDDPAEIPGMVAMVREQGFDMVSGWKKIRHDPLSKTLPSKLFNAVTRWLTGIGLHDFNCGLKCYDAQVLRAIHLHGERHRYVPLLAKEAGFGRIGEQVVRHRPRQFGTTKFGMSRFLNGFLDLLTLLFMHRYTQRPMHFFGAAGVLFILAGTTINLHLTWIKLVHGAALAGRPLLFLGVLLLVVGAQFFSIGFLGEMIASGTARREKPLVRERL